MPLVIATESAGSPEAIALLQGRDEEVSALYTPEQSFRIPIGKHVRADVIFLMARENGNRYRLRRAATSFRLWRVEKHVCDSVRAREKIGASPGRCPGKSCARTRVLRAQARNRH